MISSVIAITMAACGVVAQESIIATAQGSADHGRFVTILTAAPYSAVFNAANDATAEV